MAPSQYVIQCRFTGLIDDWIKEYATLLSRFTLAYPDFKKQIEIACLLNNFTGSKLPDDEVEDAVDCFQRLCLARKEKQQNDTSWLFPLEPVPMLSHDNWSYWGSNSQMLAGHVCKMILDEAGIFLPEFMCIALNPTAGIPGPGNTRILSIEDGSALAVHSAIHDASGYCKLYHGVGSGYNYMNTWFDLPSTSPRVGQISGLLSCIFAKNP